MGCVLYLGATYTRVDTVYSKQSVNKIEHNCGGKHLDHCFAFQYNSLFAASANVTHVVVFGADVRLQVPDQTRPQLPRAAPGAKRLVQEASATRDVTSSFQHFLLGHEDSGFVRIPSQ